MRGGGGGTGLGIIPEKKNNFFTASLIMPLPVLDAEMCEGLET